MTSAAETDPFAVRGDDCSFVRAALDFARRGMFVLPCQKDKTPYTLHGHKDATTDPDKIRAWRRKWPGAANRCVVRCKRSRRRGHRR